MTAPVPPAALTPEQALRIYDALGSSLMPCEDCEDALDAIADGSHIVLPRTRESLIAALAELEPGLMVVRWVELREPDSLPPINYHGLCYVTPDEYHDGGIEGCGRPEALEDHGVDWSGITHWLDVSGLRPPSQPAKED